MTVIYFLLCLPLAVWILSAWAQLLDGSDKDPVLKRIAIRTGLLAAAVILLGSSAATAVLAAFGLVIALHLAWFFVIRWLMAINRFNAHDLD